jgi:hypothetical protein
MECHIVYALLMCDLSEPLHDSKKVMGLVERMKGLVGDKRLDKSAEESRQHHGIGTQTQSTGSWPKQS